MSFYQQSPLLLIYPLVSATGMANGLSVTLSCPLPLFHITFSAASYRGKFPLRGAAVEGSWSFFPVRVVRILICAGWVLQRDPQPRRMVSRQGARVTLHIHFADSNRGKRREETAQFSWQALQHACGQQRSS